MMNVFTFEQFECARWHEDGWYKRREEWMECDVEKSGWNATHRSVDGILLNLLWDHKVVVNTQKGRFVIHPADLVDMFAVL